MTKFSQLWLRKNRRHIIATVNCKQEIAEHLHGYTFNERRVWNGIYFQKRSNASSESKTLWGREDWRVFSSTMTEMSDTVRKLKNKRKLTRTYWTELENNSICSRKAQFSFTLLSKTISFWVVMIRVTCAISLESEGNELQVRLWIFISSCKLFMSNYTLYGIFWNIN